MPPPADVPPPVRVASVDIAAASLYQEIILTHYRSPRHKGVLSVASPATEHRNPLCGDVLSIQVLRDGDTIADAAFTAQACSITQATASMLLSRVIGGTVPDARAVIAQVERLIETPLGESGIDGADLGDLRALASVVRFPARRACVRLVTLAMTEALATP